MNGTMSTMKTGWIKSIFLIGGLYDAVLGMIFLAASGRIFAAFQVTPPNHPAYVQFPALLILLFGIMFLQIASDPLRFRSMMPYAVGLKVAYCGIVFYYQITQGLPFMWIPFAWTDLVFLVLFGAAYRLTWRS